MDTKKQRQRRHDNVRLAEIGNARSEQLLVVPTEYLWVLQYGTQAMASAHITVQEHSHLTRHDPFGCDQKQFYMFIVYLVHQVYCIHCGTTAEKGTSVFVSLQPRAPGGLLSCYS